VLLAVNEPGDLTRLPVDREGVPGVGERPPLRMLVGAADAVRSRVSGTVHRAVHEVRLAADVLHDVDLARVRPVRLREPGPQHPERRPDALTARDLDAGFDAAVLQLDLVVRDESRRGVAGSVTA